MEKIKQYQEHARNIEQDRLTFAAAIESAAIQEIEVDFEEQSINSFGEEINEAKLFLLGETHGVKENADIIYTLFKKFGFKKLAVEWNKELREQVEKFLVTGELDFELIKDSADGRITAEYLALLKKLKNERLLKYLICFDELAPSGEWDARDANMAKNIIANLSNDPMLIVAGNLHAAVAPVTFGGEKEEHHPMGEYIKRQIPSVPSGKIKYLSGRFYNFGIGEFGSKPKGVKASKAKFYKSEAGLYIFELPEARPAIAPNPHL